jgi:hypothetical protein
LALVNAIPKPAIIDIPATPENKTISARKNNLLMS